MAREPAPPGDPRSACRGRDERELLRARHLPDPALSPGRLRSVAARLGVDELHRAPAPRVSRCRAGIVGGEAAGEAIGDAHVESPVAAAKQVTDPGPGLRDLLSAPFHRGRGGSLGRPRASPGPGGRAQLEQPLLQQRSRTVLRHARHLRRASCRLQGPDLPAHFPLPGRIVGGAGRYRVEGEPGATPAGSTGPAT